MQAISAPTTADSVILCAILTIELFDRSETEIEANMCVCVCMRV